MPFEVELKFALDDRNKVRNACLALGGRVVETRIDVDTYLRHPSRSFEQTDEALRVRRSGDAVLFTYKGPKVDATTKTRIEIELELDAHSSDTERVLEFWQRLGFSLVRDVRKTREVLSVPWHGHDVQVCMDQVDGLGEFIELELAADPAQLEQSRQLLKSLASHLTLTNSERRSYLELLLENRGSTADTAEKPEDWTE